MCRVNVIESWASSASEVLFRLLDREKISKAVAECLYTGIAHDTGIFKFSNTSRQTMEIAGFLMEKGINFPKIIDDSFFAKTYGQAKLHGRAVLDSVRILDNRCVYTVVTTDELKEYGCTVKATDGIVDQLRIIEGIEIAFLLYQTGNPDEYKVSLRTNSKVDVSRIAQSFGGGGEMGAGLVPGAELLHTVGLPGHGRGQQMGLLPLHGVAVRIDGQHDDGVQTQEEQVHEVFLAEAVGREVGVEQTKAAQTVGTGAGAGQFRDQDPACLAHQYHVHAAFTVDEHAQLTP